MPGYASRISGSDGLQRLSPCSLPGLVCQHGDPAFTLVQKLAKRKWDGEQLELLYLDALKAIGSGELGRLQQRWILDLALSKVRSKSIPDSLAKAWLQVVASLIPHLESPTIQASVLPLALQNHLPHPTTLRQRIISTVLLCVCVSVLPEEQLLQHFLGLCQDTEALIRQCIASHLPNLINPSNNSRSQAAFHAAVFAEVQFTYDEAKTSRPPACKAGTKQALSQVLLSCPHNCVT